MTEDSSQGTKERPPYRVHLPGFVRDEDIGLGDAVTRATSLFGIKACGGCERRAAVLFSGGHSR